MDECTGYMHSGYAASLAEFGTPRELPRCRGWILERQIPGTPYKDAMGCYPLFACKDWSQLHNDLEEIRKDFVTLTVVTDPFGGFETEYLKQCFEDIVVPFKDHFLADLRLPFDRFISRHHLRYARKASQRVTVETCSKPLDFLDDWDSLYRILIKRHRIAGIRAFSRQSFFRQLSIPGIVVFRATWEGETVGMLLWYTQRNHAYYHLGASSELGYAHRASFALFIYAFEYFRMQGLNWLDFGAGAGVQESTSSGLSSFKKGWASKTIPAFFCGRIFNHEVYLDLVGSKGSEADRYFPAYRENEFT